MTFGWENMLTKLKYPFQPAGHKSIMLYFLFLALIVIHAISVVIDLFRGRYGMAEIKVVVFFMLLGMLYGYVKKLNVAQYALAMIGLLEIELTLIVLKNDFLHYSTVYPMLLTFGIFFFFALKEALWLTLVHHLYWLGMFVYGYEHYHNHSILHDPTALSGMVIAYFFMVLFGLLYNISAETTYRQLERSNRQKSILLSEIHHRIKNNLNMMASVLGLQIMNIENRKTKDVSDALLNAKLRIQAMAMVHESIYKQKDFDEVSFYNYVNALADVISHSYDTDVVIDVESDYIYLPMDMMVHLGIIINELLTNSIKYAFKKGDDNRVTLSLFKRENDYLFLYHENHNYHVDLEKMMHSDTLGIKLIKLIVRQMDGTLEVTRNEGLKFHIAFPKSKMQ